MKTFDALVSSSICILKIIYLFKRSGELYYLFIFILKLLLLKSIFTSGLRLLDLPNKLFVNGMVDFCFLWHGLFSYQGGCRGSPERSAGSCWGICLRTFKDLHQEPKNGEWVTALKIIECDLDAVFFVRNMVNIGLFLCEKHGETWKKFGSFPVPALRMAWICKFDVRNQKANASIAYDLLKVLQGFSIRKSCSFRLLLYN